MNRNCNNCKYSTFHECEALNNNEEFKEIIENEPVLSKKEWNFKENFCCEKFKSMFIEYPIEVSNIETNNQLSGFMSNRVGKFVKIKPCNKDYGGKTYLGLFLGDLPIGNNVSYKEDSKELKISFSTNPAIFVFELNKIIYGCESWWGIIKNEDELKDISDNDINNVWYVKALKSLSQEK